MYYTFQNEGETQYPVISVIGATEERMTCGARRLYNVSKKGSTRQAARVLVLHVQNLLIDLLLLVDIRLQSRAKHDCEVAGVVWVGVR